MIPQPHEHVVFVDTLLGLAYDDIVSVGDTVLVLVEGLGLGEQGGVGLECEGGFALGEGV